MKLKAIVLSLVGVGLLASGVAWYSGEHPFVGAAGATAMPTQAVPATSPIAVASLPDFSELVAKYGPAVVNISVMETEKTAAMNPEPRAGSTRTIRSTGSSGNCRCPHRIEYSMRGIGSGFIVRPDGVILTNAHVVDNAIGRHDQAHRPARIQGQGAWHRQAERHRGAEDRRDQPPDGQTGELYRREGRRVGGCAGFSVWLRELGHRGHRERQAALAAAGKLHPVHPDGCCRQPG